MKHYSKIHNRIVFTCPDGDGIVIEDEKLRFFGNVGKIAAGMEGYAE